MEWYYAVNGERKGPVSADSIKTLIEAGGLSKADLVWNQSMGDKWAKIADVPVLAGAQSAQDDPKAKRLFMEKMEERRELVKRERRARIRLALIAVAVVALVAGAAAAFVLSKPRRQWGISSSNPLGTLPKLEARLIGEYQMKKEVLKESSLLKRRAAQVLFYSEAKRKLGDHVSAAGGITLLLDGNGRVEAMMATFPSPGTHGYLMIDRSVTSIFMNEIWLVHGGPAEYNGVGKAALSADTLNAYGLASIPEDGACDVRENARMRRIWIQYSTDARATMVYFEVK